MSIGENIKQLREAHGLTQAELGQIAGVTDKAVSTWEADLKVPRMGAIQKMADYFQIPKSVILDGEIIPTLGQLGKIAKILGVTVSDLIGPNDWKDLDISDAFAPDDVMILSPENSGQVFQLLTAYDHLNDEGQEKLVDYADDLVSSGKYKKHDSDSLAEEEA